MLIATPGSVLDSSLASAAPQSTSRPTVIAELQGLAALRTTGLEHAAKTIQAKWVNNRLSLWRAKSQRPLGSSPFNSSSALPMESCLDPLLVCLLRSTRTPSASEWKKLEFLLQMTPSSPENLLSLSGHLGGLRLAGAGKYLTLAWICPLTGTPLSYSPDQMAGVQSLFNDVARVLSAVPGALALVKNALQVVAVAEASADPSAIGSMSSRRLIGLTAIINPLSGPWDSYRLAGSLLHEAMHSMLYRLELEYAFYQSHAESLSIRVESPWTGRSLELHSFVHATFVWTSMFQLYRQLLSTGAQCQSLLAECWSGFRDFGDARLANAEVQRCILPDVLAAMHATIQEVRQDAQALDLM